MARTRPKNRIIPKREKFTEVITFNLTPTMRDALDRIAFDNDSEIAECMRYACELLINRYKTAGKEDEEAGEEGAEQEV